MKITWLQGRSTLIGPRRHHHEEQGQREGGAVTCRHAVEQGRTHHHEAQGEEDDDRIPVVAQAPVALRTEVLQAYGLRAWRDDLRMEERTSERIRRQFLGAIEQGDECAEEAVFQVPKRAELANDQSHQHHADDHDDRKEGGQCEEQRP